MALHFQVRVHWAETAAAKPVEIMVEIDAPGGDSAAAAAHAEVQAGRGGLTRVYGVMALQTIDPAPRSTRSARTSKRKRVPRRATRH